MALNFSAGFFDSAGGGISDLFGASGLRKEASSYQKAAKFSERAANLTQTSTNLSVLQQGREIMKVIGGQKADIGAAGLQSGGTALDLLRSSTMEGELAKQITRTQGEINKQGYLAEAAAYTGQADAAKAAAKGKTASGIGGLISAGMSLFALSDARLKTDIVFLYERQDGVRFYEFRYHGTAEVWEGVMAQEVMKIWPDAVVQGEDGYFRVDYASIGAQMRLVRAAAA